MDFTHTPPTPPRDIYHCLETVLVVTHWGGSIIGIYWVEAREAAKHPIMLRTGPATVKNYPVAQISVVLRLRNRPFPLEMQSSIIV